MAGTVERTIALKLIGDVGEIGKDLKGVDKGIATVDKRAGRLKGTLKGVGSGIASWGKAFSGALVLGGIEKAVDLVGDAWEGFRSGQRVAAQLGVTWKNLGMEARGLGAAIDSIGTKATNLGFSDDEAIQAFNDALRATKSQSQAMRRLDIAYDLVANGAAPNLGAAMKMIQQASKGSARVVDRFGLTSKTASGRVKELGEKVQGAARKAAKLNPVGVVINQLNEDLEGIVGSLATGDIDGALEAVAGAGDHIATAWEKLGSVLPQPVRDFVDDYGPRAIQVFQGLWDVGVGAISAVGTAFDVARPLVQPMLDLLGSGLSAVADTATQSLKAIASVLKGDFGGAWDTVLGVVRNAVQGMINAWNGLDVRVPPFELTWGGGTMLAGTPLAFDIPGGSFRFWSGTGDLFPDVGNVIRQNWGTGGSGPSGGRTRGNRRRQASTPKAVGNKAPGLPSHKDGLDYVPYDGYVAELHKGEGVLTAEQNRGGGGATVVNLYVTAGMGTDGRRVGEQIVDALMPYLRTGGRVRLKNAING